MFDPTSRLSGVLLPLAKGEMSHLGWEGESLIVWIGEQKYTRKMNATGKVATTQCPPVQAKKSAIWQVKPGRTSAASSVSVESNSTPRSVPA
ncbi:hypothetical protein PX52LOC_02452 [Limnoglobus roseus]|uniref:Uncharacterized protein n=1 Tax=Limnoglobus roseus TaxID=2598579 RepID=A0A5C1AER4_9BACT|nr:hypothetical protein PX52LOC_02452 [Limnoglobus roseus]